MTRSLQSTINSSTSSRAFVTHHTVACSAFIISTSRRSELKWKPFITNLRHLKTHPGGLILIRHPQQNLHSKKTIY